MQATRRGLAWALLGLTMILLTAGLAAGSDGWSLAAPGSLFGARDAAGAAWRVIVVEIRAPRTLGAWLAGALLGLAGALAQGLFRNPLADPYLLGSAAGASLAVVLVLAAGTLTGAAALATLVGAGLVVAAFVGALAGTLLTLLLARGAGQTLRLLLAGVVVGVMLTAVNDLVITAAPQALRGRQSFMLGNTGFVGWAGAGWLLAGLVLTAPVAWRLSRTLDALALGEDAARSLGLDLDTLRAALIGAMALATGLAVSQTGLIAFVGLVAPHIVRRCTPAAHGYTLLASAATGGALLLAADVLARSVVAPQELPVGVLTAVLGGGYLVVLLHRRGLPA